MFRLLLLAALLMSLGGCGGLTPAAGPMPTPPRAQPTAWPEEPAELLKRILAEPEKYLGQTITVERTLEAEGKIPHLRFFLRNEGGDGLEVSPWAPLEVVQPPGGGAKVKSMAYFVGRRLRLTGILEKGGKGDVLRVSSVQEL